MDKKPRSIAVSMFWVAFMIVATVMTFCMAFASFAVIKSYSSSTNALQEIQRARLVKSLERYLVSGVVVEIHQACKEAFKSGGVQSLKVETPTGRLLCTYPEIFETKPFPNRRNTHRDELLYGGRAGDERIIGAISFINFQDLAFDDFVQSSLFFLLACAPLTASMAGYGVLRLIRNKMASISNTSSALLDEKLDLQDRFVKIQNMPSPLNSYEALAFHESVCKVGAEYIAVEKLKIRTARAEGIAELAAQVAHDICSPLVALKLAVQNHNPEQAAQCQGLVSSAIQQISDIANQLLERRRMLLQEEKKEAQEGADVIPIHQPFAGVQKAPEPYMLFPVVEDEMGIKQLQYSREIESGNLQLQYRVSPGVQSAFVRMQPLDLKTVLSNLINNAVEALPQGKGTVTVSLDRDTMQKRVHLSVQDTGIGIPDQVMVQVLQGHSIGKTTGNGIGLVSSKKKVESWGALFDIQSKPGEGTRISIDFSDEIPPSWFQDYVVIPKGSTVVVLDDDRSIHEMWKYRWEACTTPEERESIKWVHVYTVEALMSHPEVHHDRRAIFLVDYEIRPSGKNGLDVIEALNVGYQSILVTTHYGEPDKQAAAQRAGSRILPKPYVPYVPLDLVPKHPHMVLVHEELAITRSWQGTSRGLGEYVAVCSDARHFRWLLEELPRHIPIYVSITLAQMTRPADGISQEDLSRLAHKMGFMHIFLVDKKFHGNTPLLDPKRPWVETVVSSVYPEFAPYNHRRMVGRSQWPG